MASPWTFVERSEPLISKMIGAGQTTPHNPSRMIFQLDANVKYGRCVRTIRPNTDTGCRQAVRIDRTTWKQSLASFKRRFTLAGHSDNKALWTSRRSIRAGRRPASRSVRSAALRCANNRPTRRRCAAPHRPVCVATVKNCCRCSGPSVSVRPV